MPGDSRLCRFFTVTGVLLVFVAAGVFAYGVHDLQEAALVPGLHTLAFDVSAYVPPTSWYGALLKGIFNFSPQTTVAEAVVWVGYVVVVLATPPANCPRPPPQPALSASTSPTPAAKPPSSTSTAKTAGYSARSRTSAPA